MITPHTFILWKIELIYIARWHSDKESACQCRKTQVWSLVREDPLEEEMATHSVFLPGKSHGWRSLTGYSPWDCRVGHNWVTNSSLCLIANKIFIHPKKDVCVHIYTECVYIYIYIYIKFYTSSIQKCLKNKVNIYMGLPDWTITILVQYLILSIYTYTHAFYIYTHTFFCSNIVDIIISQHMSS